MGVLSSEQGELSEGFKHECRWGVQKKLEGIFGKGMWRIYKTSAQNSLDLEMKEEK